jgi:hypothetical protein
MNTITVTMQSQIGTDGKLRLEMPCALPPGPVEVVLTVKAVNGAILPSGPPWDQLLGRDKDVWQGVDVECYLAELREDKEVPNLCRPIRS